MPTAALVLRSVLAHVAALVGGAFTSGHLWMAALGGTIVMLVVMAALRDLAASRDPSDG